MDVCCPPRAGAQIGLDGSGLPLLLRLLGKLFQAAGALALLRADGLVSCVSALRAAISPCRDHGAAGVAVDAVIGHAVHPVTQRAASEISGWLCGRLSGVNAAMSSSCVCLREPASWPSPTW